MTSICHDNALPCILFIPGCCDVWIVWYGGRCNMVVSFIFHTVNTFTENKRSSIWQPCRHWWHRKLRCHQYRQSCQLDGLLFSVLRPRQNCRQFPYIFKCIFLNEKYVYTCILINISQKLVPKCLINDNPALVQIMAWGRPGDKPLSEPMMVSLPTHIYVARPQWVHRHWHVACVDIHCRGRQGHPCFIFNNISVDLGSRCTGAAAIMVFSLFNRGNLGIAQRIKIP